MSTNKGALIVNLGSPDSTSTKDVKRYLGEFLMDERVIDVNYLLRTFLVKGIILNTRPKKSAAAYKKIWWDEGSPLIVWTKRILKKVQKQSDVPVEMAMRYGNPSIRHGLEQLKNKGIDEVLLFPLYPHYAMSSYETVVVKAEEEAAKLGMQLTIIPPFYNHTDYIRVLAQSIKDNLPAEYDKILFSYHGIPERHIRKSDTTNSHCKLDKSCCNTPSKAHETCYKHQCLTTTKEVVKFLQLDETKVTNSFQSRLGRDPWLKPYTDFVINDFPGEGVKKLVVITPAFVSDCLETLEEIGMEAREEFIEHGGEEFTLIPCLNDRDDWSEVISRWINEWK